MLGELDSLLERARELEAELSAAAAAPEQGSSDADQLSCAARRLRRSVIRPLEEALGRGSSSEGGQKAPPHPRKRGVGAPAAHDRDSANLLAGEPFWQLALDATRVRLTPGLPTEVQEATAALQDLACQFAPAQADGGTSRLAELEGIQAELPCVIQSAASGPYLGTNLENLTNWLGEWLSTRPQMALCRCGQSAIKPLCDGTHAEIGFTAEKDPRRVPDRRDTYVGQQATILDNRGICQHSGYCTDRLGTVFHSGEEPFVTPSGGRMDEIVRAVRDCPSGALSYAMDRREAREQVDYDGEREAALEVSRDGPYRITGAIALTDSHGKHEARNEGASGEHYALCRCGHSQNKPFCSGMHWYVDFKDPVPDPEHEPTIFEWCGGLPALTKMSRLFYEKYVPQDPLLAPLFAHMSADHPQRVAKWLAEVAISGLGMALFFAPVANVVLSSVAPEKEGQASGANNAIRELGGVFGVAVLAAVFTVNGGYHSGQQFVDGMNPAVLIGAGLVAVGAIAAFAIKRTPRTEPVEAATDAPLLTACACASCWCTQIGDRVETTDEDASPQVPILVGV